MKTVSFVSSHRQSGFSLLEVLIAVLVFSVGLMGLAGLQVVGMKANQNALLRSIASEAAYDMLDQLRANSKGTIKVADWNAMLASLLPGGKGAVCTLENNANASACASWVETDIADPTNGHRPSRVFLHVRVEWTQASVGSAAPDEVFVSAEDSVQKIIVTGQL